MLAAAPGCRKHGDSSSLGEPWDFSAADIVASGATHSPSIVVDLYLDSTVSMEGFVRPQDSALVRFVEELEGSLKSGWTSQVHYFKFGTRVAELDRDVFVRGIRAPQ